MNKLMQKKFIKTSAGDIAVFTKSVPKSKNTPIIFLHGVYFDHNLWEEQISNINDRTIVAVDMPSHGESKINIKKNWTLGDCALMLIEILDELNIKKVIAVGHSWGSMTIIRANKNRPELFESIVLCNMPFKAPKTRNKILMQLQQSALLFKKFYIKQAGQALFSKASLESNPDLLQKIIVPMSKLSRLQIIHTNRAVILDSEDTSEIIKTIKTHSLALVGKEDYVGKPPIKDITIAKGGHISPLEDPATVSSLIERAL